MRWKLMFRVMVLGLLSVLLIGCTVIMVNPTTKEMKVYLKDSRGFLTDKEDKEIEELEAKGWKEEKVKDVEDLEREGFKKVEEKKEGDDKDPCKDTTPRQPIVLPGSDSTEKPPVDDKTSKVAVKFGIDTGCSALFDPVTGPCSKFASSACTGPAGTYCGTTTGAASAGGATCSSTAADTGFFVNRTGATCIVTSDASGIPAANTVLRPAVGALPSTVDFVPVNGCTAAPTPMPHPGTQTVTVTGVACPTPGTYTVTTTAAAGGAFNVSVIF